MFRGKLPALGQWGALEEVRMATQDGTEVALGVTFEPKRKDEEKA